MTTANQIIVRAILKSKRCTEMHIGQNDPIRNIILSDEEKKALVRHMKAHLIKDFDINGTLIGLRII